MRILLIVVYFSPSTTSAARMMRDLALEYAKQGHEVTVVTPSETVVGPICVTVEDGITVVRVKTGDLKSADKLARMWRESRLSKILWAHGMEYFEAHPCDLIVFYSPSIFLGHLVRRLKSMWHGPAYLILRDIFPKWALDTGVLREGILYRYLKRIEREQYAVADVIGVEAPGDLPYLHQELSGGKLRAEVLYNWLGTQETPVGASGWRQKLELDGKVVFFYGGNIGVAQDLDNIVRLAEGLRERQDIYFLLIGSGSEVKRLNREIERRGLVNIGIYPAISQEEYMECLVEFDVGLISLDSRLKSNNFTGKLLGYILCAKPVLASVRAGHDLIQVLREYNAGIGCANGMDSELRAAAVQLASDSEMRLRMGANARDLGDRIFSVEVIAKQIVSHFKREEDRKQGAGQATRRTLGESAPLPVSPEAKL